MASREPELLGGEPGPVPGTEEGSDKMESADSGDSPPVNPDPFVATPRPRRASRPSRADAPTFHVAGFWRRVASGLIDTAVILPVSLLMCWIAGAVADVHLPASRHQSLDFWLDLFLASDPALVGILGLTCAIALVYLFVFQLTLGRTLGMRALKIRIIDVYGDEPSTARAVVRTVGYLAGLATLGLGFLWVGFDAEKRGLHDWISSTYVVRA